MSTVHINVGGKLFTSTKDTFSKCAYFAGLFATGEPEDIPFVDRPSTGFKHVLYYLQDDRYPFPIEFALELDFYGVPYPKYSQMRKKDVVNVFVAGEKFTVKAHHLMKNSPYFEKKLSQLYVGADLRLRESAKTFSHFLQRIYDRKHYIPIEYKEEFEKYQGPAIEWAEDTVVTHLVSGTESYTRYSVLAKIPFLTDWLATGFVPEINVPIKAWQNITNHLSLGYPALLSYYEWYEELKVVPVGWYRVVYNRCPASGCNTILKCIVEKRFISHLSPPQHCEKHGCTKCNEYAKMNNLCLNHQ